MLVMDGWEAMKRIQEMEAKQPRAAVPMIGITALATADRLKQCLNSGMNDLLPKPFTKRQLHQALSNWLFGAPNEAASAAPANSSSL
jgi:CheY-like chemotaxis protein